MSVLSTSVPPSLDLGLLLISNPNPLDPTCIRGPELEPYLAAVARENAQSLLSGVWQLPAERAQDAVVAVLPPRTTALPREKPPPKPKLPSRWEEFARLKSIKKAKKDRAVWDEASGEWRPNWGFGRADDPSKQWLLEVPQSADPNEDQFARLKGEKRERVAKNEFQRLKNISRNLRLGGTLSALGGAPKPGPGAGKELKRALVVAKRSDASVGQFSGKVAGEKVSHLQGRRRQFLPNTGAPSLERGMQEQVLRELAARRSDPLNAERAVNRLQQQREKAGITADADGEGGRRQKKGTVGKVSAEGGKSRRQNVRDNKSRKYKKAAVSGRARQKLKTMMKSKTLGKRK